MTAPGSLRIAGLGPGGGAWTTPEASQLIAHATDLAGYAPYLDRLPHKQGQTRHESGNGAELERARHVLRLAGQGRHVVLVSGGDPGVFAMAAAVFVNQEFCSKADCFSEFFKGFLRISPI